MQIKATGRKVFFVTAGLLIAPLARSDDITLGSTFAGESSCFGNYKMLPVDLKRFFVVYDENCFSLGEGLLSNITWHCWGTTDFVDGLGSGQGYCIGTAPNGNKLTVHTGPDEKHEARQLSWRSPAILDGGTGRFAGISGDAEYVNHANQFRPAADGTFFNHVTIRGRYRLP